MEKRRCANCNTPLYRKLQRETPKEFEKRAYCGPACRRIGMRKVLAEVRTGVTHKKKEG